MIVFDASTLILLARIEMLEIFVADYTGDVFIPEKVRSEACRKDCKERPLIEKVLKDRKINNLKLKSRKEITKLMDDFNIDAGETEALLLALQEGADLVATDDRNAIRACKMMNIEFVTAIAFLIRAFEKGLIEREETLLKLEKLKTVGRYSKAIVEDARKKITGGK